MSETQEAPDSTQELLSEIDNYIKDRKISDTAFGRDAMNDPRFVFSLREGRSPSLKNADRVRAFMAAVSNSQASA